LHRIFLISILVLFRAGFIDNPTKPEPPEIDFTQDTENSKLIVTYVSKEVRWTDLEIRGICDKSQLGISVIKGDMLNDCEGTISIYHPETETKFGPWYFSKEPELPESIISGEQRTVSPKDEGAHYKDKLLVNREWWYYTAIFNQNTELPGWALTISFNHMARDDLFFSKPDLLFVTLHSPDGKEYGGIVEKSRPLLGDYAILKEPSLQVSSSDEMFKVSFEDSYVQGSSPNWYIHIEGEIDDDSDIAMDLTYEAESSPFWTYSSRIIDNSKSSVASYMFPACNVEGTVTLDGMDYQVKGIGHHEHTWINGLLTSGLIRGWDWCHTTLENGWNIYYSNYYFTSQFKSEKTYKINLFSNIVITTDKGKKLTLLEDTKIDIKNSDKLFLLLNMPNRMTITSQNSPTQLGLKGTNTKLTLNINSGAALDKQWKRFAHVGMKIGRADINGRISWTDNDGNHEIQLNGIGTIWNMRH
jgi:predicted secreted hydrolase